MKHALILLAVCFTAPTWASESVCYGRVANGRLEGGVKLPGSGPNFEAYSTVGVAAGRTYVHSAVRDIVVAAYSAAEKAAPGVTYIYGETGWADGGRIRPHRTHQNGLSVDFMVPVRDEQNRPVTIPRSPFNKFGYALEFDEAGREAGLHIDFGAIAEHLYQLDVAARKDGSGLALVIFDERYLPRLFATPHGDYLRKRVPFMKGKPWIRHDEHYHVDFVMACRSA